jgi:hypothetical protein
MTAIVLASAGHCLQRFSTRVRACEQARSVQLFVDSVLVLRAAGQGLSEQTLKTNAVVFRQHSRLNPRDNSTLFCNFLLRPGENDSSIKMNLFEIMHDLTDHLHHTHENGALLCPSRDGHGCPSASVDGPVRPTCRASQEVAWRDDPRGEACDAPRSTQPVRAPVPLPTRHSCFEQGNALRPSGHEANASSQWLRMHAVGGGGQWMDVDFLLWSKCAWAFSGHRLLAPLSRNMQKQHSLLQVKRLSSHACISARSMLSRSPRARASESPAECRAASATTRVGSLTRRAHTRATLRQTSVWAFPLST